MVPKTKKDKNQLSITQFLPTSKKQGQKVVEPHTEDPIPDERSFLTTGNMEESTLIQSPRLKRTKAERDQIHDEDDDYLDILDTQYQQNLKKNKMKSLNIFQECLNQINASIISNSTSIFKVSELLRAQ